MHRIFTNTCPKQYNLSQQHLADHRRSIFLNKILTNVTIDQIRNEVHLMLNCPESFREAEIETNNRILLAVNSLIQETITPDHNLQRITHFIYCGAQTVIKLTQRRKRLQWVTDEKRRTSIVPNRTISLSTLSQPRD